jgi:hypothetical protein
MPSASGRRAASARTYTGPSKPGRIRASDDMGTQQAFSSDAMLLVFASEYYDRNDYIESYDDFRVLVAKAPGE